MPILFVHGVKVRHDRFNNLLKTLREEIASRLSGMQVEGFFWGDRGVQTPYEGKSIPDFQVGARALDLALPIQDLPLSENQLKMFLLEDPYLELLAWQDREEFDPAGAGFTPLPVNVQQRNHMLYTKKPHIITIFQNHQSLRDAIGGEAVLGDTIATIVQRAFNLAGRMDRSLSTDEIIAPLSRCLTAALYSVSPAQSEIFDSEFSWSLVEDQVRNILEQELGGQRGWVGQKAKLGSFAAFTLIMRLGIRQRIMKSLAVFIGDILAYFAQRDMILRELDHKVVDIVGTSNDPLWLIGHSLGGIICFDYCCRTSRTIERLVTVGSQVGLLGELEILKSNSGAPILEKPKHVKNWLNIYDPNDFLSFLANPIFSEVTDIEINTQAPFPLSHSEYWKRLEVYNALTTELS
jgi:hypothetical protein